MTGITLTRRGKVISMALITFLVFGMGSYAFFMPDRQKERGLWVGHTRQVLEQLRTLHSHMVLFPQTMPLPADVIRHVSMDLGRLEQLVNDNPHQMERLSTIRGVIAQQGSGSEVTRQLADMIGEEEELLKIRTMRWERSADTTRFTLAGATALLYLFLLYAYGRIERDVAMRQRMFEAERHTSEAQRAIAARLAKVIEIQRDVAYERLNLDKVMQIITERCQEIIGGDGAVVEMVDGGEMVYRAASGIVKPYKGLRIKAQGSLSGLCSEHKKMLYCPDSEEDPRVDREACRKVGVRSMVVVPLLHHRHSVGVLKVASAKPDAFGDEDSAVLEMMAGVISSTMNDAEAAHALQVANAKLSEVNTQLEAQKGALEDANTVLEERATTDGLTGLRNNRYFREALADEFARARRHGTPLTVMLLDVDSFKQFNDTFGHAAGDAVLKQVAAQLKRTARGNDCVARYGGEEFALLLPHTDRTGANVLAERMRQVVADMPCDYRQVTVSIGVANLDEKIEDADRLVEAADKALYRSKALGRNRVTHADAPIAA